MKPQLLTLLESNIDDASPELYPHILSTLFEAGALDAWLTPIIMKHGRPAVCLSALVPPDRVTSIREIFFRETTTLGVRCSAVERYELEREILTVSTDVGEIEVKVGRNADGTILNLAPEYSSCQSVAKRAKLPLKTVFQIALAAAQQQLK